MYRVCIMALKHFNLPKDRHARKNIIAKNMREVWPWDTGIATSLFSWEQQRNYCQSFKFTVSNEEWVVSKSWRCGYRLDNKMQGKVKIYCIFCSKGIWRVEWEQVEKEEGSHQINDTVPLAQLLWERQVDTRATQLNREKSVLQAKSHRKQLTRGTHSHQQMHNMALPSNSIYDTPQLYTLRMTVLYLLIQAEFFLLTLSHNCSVTPFRLLFCQSFYTGAWGHFCTTRFGLTPI